MKKFPVISENGFEYEVKLKRYSFSKTIYEVYVYTRSTFLGIPVKFLENYRPLGVRCYCAVEYDYDFIKMAKDEVRRMEEEFAEEISDKAKLKEGLAKFNEWDGDCK